MVSDTHITTLIPNNRGIIYLTQNDQISLSFENHLFISLNNKFDTVLMYSIRSTIYKLHGRNIINFYEFIIKRFIL